MGREILDLAASYIKPGITTDEIDAVVHEATIARGAYPSPLNYRQFPKSLCTSINETICHGIPDQRKLKEGDIINLGKIFPPHELIETGTMPSRRLGLL